MPIRYVTYANGFTEIFGDDRTPAEEREWLSKASGVSKFPSANHRTSLKSPTSNSINDISRTLNSSKSIGQ